MTDREMLAKVKSFLEQTSCEFFACPGHEKPFKDMATCRVCTMTQELRDHLEENKD